MIVLTFIELDELYRMVMTSSGLNHWIPSARANPRRSAEFFFVVKYIGILYEVSINEVFDNIVTSVASS